MRTRADVTPGELLPLVERVFAVAAAKVRDLHRAWDPTGGSPVFTVEGRYTSRSWTDWTLGFFVGMPILLFDATDDGEFFSLGRDKTLALMPPHLTAMGVHDHGFNIVSSYGNLRRLMREGRIASDASFLALCELALKVSGAVQAARYARTEDGKGYLYSFNGPHSLFADTMRTLRSLVLAHQLGHVLMGEADRPISLLERALHHAETTARYNVYYGEGRDAYDVPGRVAHESVFNPNNGQYRCPSTQQGYSPFTTWTRGAAWVILGYAEQLEWLRTRPEDELTPYGGEFSRRSACGQRAPQPTITSRATPARTASPSGTRARPAWPRSATIAMRPRIRSTPWSRWTPRRRLSRRRGSSGWGGTSRPAERPRPENATCALG